METKREFKPDWDKIAAVRGQHILLNMAINNTEQNGALSFGLLPASKDEFMSKVSERFIIYKKLHDTLI